MSTLTSSYLLAAPNVYYPWFDVIHILLCVVTIRKEAGKRFAHDHPFATWLSCMVSSFAGSLIANPLLGKPMFKAFSDEHLLLLGTGIYFAIFFSPGDVVFKLVTQKAFYIPLCAIKEVYRAKKVFAGLEDGRLAFPNSPLVVPVTIAVIKGNGSAFMTPIARLIRGEWKPADTEIMKPSVATKECLLAAVLFTRIGTGDLLYLALVGLFIAVKVGSITGNPIDPFAPIESALMGFINTFSSPGDAKTDKKTK